MLVAYLKKSCYYNLDTNFLQNFTALIQQHEKTVFFREGSPWAKAGSSEYGRSGWLGPFMEILVIVLAQLCGVNVAEKKMHTYMED